MGHAHIRVPPDSTGKRMHARAFVDFNYEGLTQAFELGDVVTFFESGIIATISRIEVTTSTTGQVHAGITANSAEDDPVAGESIYLGGVEVATVSGTAVKYYDQAMILTGKDIDSWLEVDSYGAAYTRYQGGAPLFSTSGEEIVADIHTQNTYLFTYSELPELIESKETANGTVAYNGTAGGVDLSLTAASGDKAEMRTNNYHKNVYGASRILKFAVVASDNGTANVDRKFGYFDDSDGVFIGHNGEQWYVGYRSSMSGSVVDYITLQEDWNIDRLDGSEGVMNKTKTDLDLSKINLLSIDINWMNAGDVRFGGIIGGGAGTASFGSFHILHLHNVNALSFMRTGSLPLSWETSNTGVAEGASWLRCHTAVVQSAGVTSMYYEPFSAYSAPVTLNSAENYTVIGSMRAAQLFLTKRNTKRIVPQKFDIYSTAPILVKLVKNQTLADEEWTSAGADSGLEISFDGNITDTGKLLLSVLIPSHEVMDLSNVFDLNKELIIRKCFDNLAADEYTVQARLLSAGSATVYATLLWNEIR